MSDRVRRSIIKKMNSMIKKLDVEELEFIMKDEYMQSTEILHFMEINLFKRTTRFRERCKRWTHKMNLYNTQYPTLQKLVEYRHAYENWDGLEPFPGREVKPISYYLD